MRKPFANNQSNRVPTMPAMHTVTRSSGATTVGGVAPNSQTVGVRRDFSYAPSVRPDLFHNGGLKAPVNG